MDQFDVLQTIVTKNLREQLKTMDMPDAEKKAIEIAVNNIIYSTSDFDQALYAVLDFLEEEAGLPAIVPKIESFFIPNNL